MSKLYKSSKCYWKWYSIIFFKNILFTLQSKLFIKTTLSLKKYLLQTVCFTIFRRALQFYSSTVLLIRQKKGSPFWFFLNGNIPKSLFYASRRPTLLNWKKFRLVFGRFFRDFIEKCITKSNLTWVYLKCICQSNNLSLPIWVLKIHLPQKVCFTFQGALLLNKKPQL